MKTVSAAKFKQQCLTLLDRLDSEGIIITKHGKPVAKLVSIHTDSAALIGSFKGKSSSREISSPPVLSGMLNLDTHG